jgi:hypothetical protein
MTEQSNRAWMKGWGNQPQHNIVNPDGLWRGAFASSAEQFVGNIELSMIRAELSRQDALAMLRPPITADQQRILDWKRIQREKEEARRKARWRVFWNLVLAVGCGVGCGAALGGFVPLMLWVLF